MFKRFIELKENPGYEFSGNPPRILINVDAINAVCEFSDELTTIWIEGRNFNVHGSYEEIINAMEVKENV